MYEATPPKTIEGGEFKTKVSDVKHAEGEMVRSPDTGKTDFSLVFRGPLFRRWAELLSRGAVNYGADNWLSGAKETDPTIRKKIRQRYKKSAARHFWQWMMGMRDEDHMAAIAFNVNGYELMLLTEPDSSRREETLAELAALTEDA